MGLGLLPSPPAVCRALALPGTLEAEEAGAGPPPGAPRPPNSTCALCVEMLCVISDLVYKIRKRPSECVFGFHSYSDL